MQAGWREKSSLAERLGTTRVSSRNVLDLDLHRGGVSLGLLDVDKDAFVASKIITHLGRHPHYLGVRGESRSGLAGAGTAGFRH
jgi:hypothetical protein